MKKGIIAIVILLCLTGISHGLKAQSKKAQYFSMDSVMKDKPIKEGSNLVYTSKNGYRLFMTKTGKNEPVYLFKKGDGSVIPSTTQTTTERGVRRCWQCIPAPNGDVDCFSIPCPSVITTGKGRTL